MSKPEPRIAVQVHRVSKQFQEGDHVVHALRNVQLTARTGEMTMIVGPSGCGKTTLLSVIAGTLRSDSGEAVVLGKSLEEMSDRAITEFRRTQIGFIFQQYHLIKTLNIFENVMIPLMLNGCKWDEALQKAEAMLDKVGLKGRGGDSPSNLSGGQQQRVAIARALVHEPALLICDEPTSALDAETGARVLELISEIARRPNRCVIVVTHDSRIFKYADFIARMNDGAIMSIESNQPS